MKVVGKKEKKRKKILKCIKRMTTCAEEKA